MLGSTILDVAIGLILIYLILSLISSAILESIASFMKTRSSTLVTGMCELLGDEKLMKDLYNHPLINSLYKGQHFDHAKKLGSLPSYIPASSFSLALLDLVVKGRDTHPALQSGPESRVVSVQNIRSQITRLGNERVQRAVLSALDAAQGDLAATQANIEQWFNSSMDRVSGWYKKKTQFYVFIIGLILVIFVDADTIMIARRLYVDPAQREAAVAIAGGVKATDSLGGTRAVIQRADDKLKNLGLPLAWETVHVSSFPPTHDEWVVIGKHSLRAFFGWILTAFAISLGASFWFDALSKIMMIRSALKPGQQSSAADTPPSNSQRAPAPIVTAAVIEQASPAPAPAAASTPSSSAPPPVDFQPQAWASGHADSGII
ncbi:MAG: hypothetical protein ABJE47_09990 [bacterium]